MPKKSPWPAKIINALRKKSLNYDELYNKVEMEVKAELGNIGPYPKKKFAEALMSLLKNHIIQIRGYDFQVYSKTDRIQSFKKEGVIIHLVKTEIFEIYSLISQLNDLKPERIKYAYDELRDILRKKIMQYEDKQFEKWEKLKANIISETLKKSYDYFEEKISFLNKVDPINQLYPEIEKFVAENYKQCLKLSINNYKGTHHYIPIELLRLEIGERINMASGHIRDNSEHVEYLMLKKIYSEILKKYKNAKRMYTTVRIPTNKFNTQGSFSLSMGIIDLEGTLDTSDFLSISRIKEPERMSDESVNSIFHSIIFEIFTTEDNFLKFGLSNALSDSEESLEWLRFFVKGRSIKSKRMKKKLLKSLRKSFKTEFNRND